MKRIDLPPENYPPLPSHFSTAMLLALGGSQLILLMQNYGALQVEGRLNGEPPTKESF
jgi:hypothetical protein